MLQFIVLGYVPGTSVQLSFTDILLLAGTGLAVACLAFYWIKYQNRRRLSHAIPHSLELNQHAQ